MGDLHTLPDVREAEREASEWIARLQADDVSADDRARFEAWRSAHSYRAEAYERLMRTWRQFVAAGPLVRAVSFAQSVGEPVDYYAPRRRWALATAATALVVALLAAVYFVRMPTTEQFTTAVGEQAAISLPDGSSVQLNSNSTVRVEYGARSRVIRLDRGEAFFEVAHDVNRPFWVASGKSWVRAVGTAFNVNVRPTGVRVIVSEGVVKLGYVESGRGKTSAENPLGGASVSVLNAGQEAELLGSRTSTRGLSAQELARAVSWRSGSIYFENQTLGEVVEEINRYTPLRLVVADDKLRKLLVGGTFQANPQGAEALLTMLEQGFGLSVSREGDRAFILASSGRSVASDGASKKVN